MKFQVWTPPVTALVCGLSLVGSAVDLQAFSVLGFSLELEARDFRVFNNFADPQANDNQASDPNFPGHQGAVMAIWKASVEWGCTLHGDGGGDPHQPGDLGSGGANFDAIFQGEANSVGSINSNTHSAISSLPGGVIAMSEGGAGGWRIRYNDSWTWSDGPGGIVHDGELDLQSVATHEYGHVVGIGHSSVSGATMGVSSLGVDARSLEADDSAAIQAVYGVCSVSKPLISGISIQPTQIQIAGSNFDSTANEVWFTPAGTLSDGVPIKVVGLTSNGSLIQVSIPSGAGSGDLFVRVPGTGGASLSTPWPVDLGTPCATPENYCAVSSNSVGLGALISSSGSVSLASADLVLLIQGCPANKPGLFYYGPDQVDLPFGEGRRCVGGSVFRLAPVITNQSGSVSQALDFSAAPLGSGAGQATPGSAWNFQFWYRDPFGGSVGFNTSDGLSVAFCP